MHFDYEGYRHQSFFKYWRKKTKDCSKKVSKKIPSYQQRSEAQGCNGATTNQPSSWDLFQWETNNSWLNEIFKYKGFCERVPLGHSLNNQIRKFIVSNVVLFSCYMHYRLEIKAWVCSTSVLGQLVKKTIITKILYTKLNWHLRRKFSMWV